MDMRILVQVDNRRKIVGVSTGDLKELKAAVLAEFNGVLLPGSKVIFQKWDKEFSDYVDLEEGSRLEDKDKVQVLQELSINDRTCTPTVEHWKTLRSPGTSSISSAESSKSTLSLDTDMSSDEEAETQVPKEPPQGIPIPDGLPSSFRMPQHFGQKVDRALKSGLVDNKIRNSVVRTVATCVRAVVKKPTPFMCEYLARKLIQSYPCLRERDPREYLKQAGVKVDSKGKSFKNWEILKRQFQRKFENMKSGQSDKEEEHSDCSMQEEGHAGIEPTTDVDDTISTERNITKLKSELTKTKWNAKTVQELLRATFTARRKAMLKVDARSRITKTLQEYRCLSHQVEFETELLNCLQKTCNIILAMEEMMSSWTKLVDPLINMAKKRKILTEVDEDPDKKEIAALQCLPGLFKLKNALAPDADKHLIVVVEGDISFEAAKEKAPSSSPFLIVVPGKQVLLMKDNKEEYMELSDVDGLARVVVCLVGMYYVYHMEYPAPAKGAFIFLQEHILHDFLTKRPLRYVTWLADLKLPSI